ncbi:hypothetical protein CgunFtcFv8_025814 [Champsocephalus gunnari]|uniref:Rab11 family-interacting protein 1 n=1 Tax=Champsocephalus gunnari TaxID=52237 RepID=A0AAN8H3D6_CHAGU|nr:hypothetical protein CgunFtcFv8_025814 [Champsocephalus gunnari]
MSMADLQWWPTNVQVTVLQSRGLRIKGKNGTNDAYAIMQVGKEKFQTSVVEKSVAPVWKEEAAFDLPPPGRGGPERGTLHVHVLHRALVGPDKLLGQAVINLLELSEDKTRSKTEWFKLLDKTGKADKDRGEVLVDIQFTRNNMTASMFDISAAGKSKSRLGKFKDKVRGKKKESDAASNILPSFSQVLTDSEEEGNGEGTAGKDDKKKKHKIKSLFSTKSNLQKNMSQSMSILPAKNSSLSGSQSSGLNMDSSEGKKKFKFMIHKRSGSSDSKDSGHQKQGAAEQRNLCINGSHVYREEPPPRSSRIGSNFSLTSSGNGSMEDVPENSPPSVDSLRAVRQYSPWTEEEEEEEVEHMEEDVEEQREEERIKMEKEKSMKQEEEHRVRKQEEEIERLTEEKRLEEEKRREEERVRKEEEDGIRREEEERAQQEMRRQEEDERERLAEEKRRREEQERIEEEKVRKEDEERIRMEENRIEEERRREEEERERLAEGKRRREEQERIEEEKVRKEDEERIRMEENRIEEERRREEQERIEEEKVRKEEKRVEEERRHREEEERARRQEDELAGEKRRLEEERRIEEEGFRKKEEMRREQERAEEEQRKREEEGVVRRQEEEHEKKRRREEQQERQREEEDRIRMEEERTQEERRRQEESARREEQCRSAEKIRVEEERSIREGIKREEAERRQRETEEMVRRQQEEREEQERRQREEEERMKTEEEETTRREKETLRQEEERRRIEAEEKRKREERIRMEEEMRKKEEERKQLAEEKRKLEEQEMRRIEEEEKFREERRQVERSKKEKEERLLEEEMRRETKRIEEEEKVKREEERIRREQKERGEEARKLEEEKATRKAEQQKKKDASQNKHKVAVEIPAEVPSNPFDEKCATNPFEEDPDSPAGADKMSAIQQRVQSAAPLVGSKSISTDEKDPISAQREKRLAPQPPGRNRDESQKDGSAQQLPQITKKSSDKDIKTISVLPQRSVQMIAPISRPSTEAKNTQSSTQSSAPKDTSNEAKHSKRPAPLKPLSVEEEPSSKPKITPSSDGSISHTCLSVAKQVPIAYGLNPFEEDIAPEDEAAPSSETGSGQRPSVASQAADKDDASQTKIKPSKARAPLPSAAMSTLINQNEEGEHVTGATHASDPKSEAQKSLHVQDTPLRESQPATVQSAAEEAGGKKGGAPVPLRRLQPVKPLNPLEQQSLSVVQGERDAKSSRITCEGQEKTKVDAPRLKGPYSQLTQEELISLVLKQETKLLDGDKKISELELYIDHLLVRIIEEKPSILMSLNSAKKAA